jgi:hypothetical protein
MNRLDVRVVTAGSQALAVCNGLLKFGGQFIKSNGQFPFSGLDPMSLRVCPLSSMDCYIRMFADFSIKTTKNRKNQRFMPTFLCPTFYNFIQPLPVS